MSVDQSSEKKFLILKKKLDALHYSQPLSLESSSLVEKLLNDLIRTTEGNLKKQNESIQRDQLQVEKLINPLKHQISKLTSENNELHQELIRVKEDCDFQESKWKSQFRSLEGEKKDLKFYSTQKDQQIHKLENNNTLLKKKIDNLLVKFYLPSSEKGLEDLPKDYHTLNIANLENISMPRNKQQEYELKEQLEEYQLGKSEDYEKWSQNLREADEKAYNLQQDLNRVNDAKKILEQKVKHMEMQINNRDREITRMNSKIENGDQKVEKISSDYEMQEMMDLKERLNNQIDFLSKENFKFEEEIKDLNKELNRTQSLRNENDNLLQKNKDLVLKFENQKIRLKESDDKKDLMKRMHEKQLMIKEQEHIDLQQKLNQQETAQQELKEQIKLIQLKNKDLEKNQDVTNNLVSAYQSDKKAFIQSVDVVKSEKEQLVKQINDLNELITEKDNEINDFNDLLNQNQNQIQVLNREVTLSSKNHERMLGENKNQNLQINELKAKIQDHQNEILNLTSQYNDLKLELERQTRNKEHIQEMLDQIKYDSGKVRSEKENEQLTNQRTNMLFQQAQKDNEFLKKDLKAIEQLYNEAKQNLFESEQTIQSNNAQNKILQENVKNVEREHNITSEQLSLTLHDLRQSESARTQLQRDIISFKGFEKKCSELEKKNQNLYDEIAQFESEKLQIRKQNNMHTIELQQKSEQIQQLNEQLDKEKLEQERLQSQLHQIKTETFSLTQGVKKGKESEYECSQLQQLLDKSRQRERDQIQENEKLLSEIKRYESLIQAGNRQIENINKQKEEFLAEIKELKEEVLSSKNFENGQKTFSYQLTEKLQNQDIIIQDLKELLSTEQNKCQNLQAEISALSQQIRGLQTSKSHLDDQILQLKTLTEGQERTREELMQRLQTRQQDRTREEFDRNALQDEIQSFKNKYNQLEIELIETKKSLINIDKERDEMQNQLDLKCEQNDKLIKNLKQIEQELKDTQQQNFDNQNKLETGFTQQNNISQQFAEAKTNLSSQQDEINALKSVLQERQREIQHLNEDAGILTRENQKLNHELVLTVKEKEQINNMFENTYQEGKQLQQTLRGKSMENQDVMQNYKAVCLENERLERNVQELVQEVQNHQHAISQYEKQMQYSKQQEASSEMKQNQIYNDMQQQAMQLQYLGQLNEKLEIQCQESVNQVQYLQRELDYQQKNQDQSIDSNNEIQKNYIVMQNERNQLHGMNQDMQYEINNLNQQLECEKQRVLQLEQLLQNQRLMIHENMQSFEQQSARSVVEDDKDSQNKSISTGWEKLRIESENFKKIMNSGNSGSQQGGTFRQQGLSRDYRSTRK